MKTDTSIHHTHTCPSQNIVIDDSSGSFTMKSTMHVEILFDPPHCWWTFTQCMQLYRIPPHTPRACMAYIIVIHAITYNSSSANPTSLNLVPKFLEYYDTEMSGIFLLAGGRLRRIAKPNVRIPYVHLSRPAGSRRMRPAGANCRTRYSHAGQNLPAKEPSRREP